MNHYKAERSLSEKTLTAHQSTGNLIQQIDVDTLIAGTKPPAKAHIHTVRRYLLLSQVTLFGCMLICSLIVPGVVRKEGGASDFGNHASTIVPYILGFLLNVVFMYLAVESMLRLSQKLSYLARCLMFLNFLTLGLLFSTFPRNLSVVYSDIHDWFSIVLFSYEFLLSAWLVIQQRTSQAVSYLTLQTVGSAIGMFSALKVINLLYVGQFLGSLGFALILLFVLPDVIAQKIAAKPGQT